MHRSSHVIIASVEICATVFQSSHHPHITLRSSRQEFPDFLMHRAVLPFSDIHLLPTDATEHFKVMQLHPFDQFFGHSYSSY
jgi:hypothetical protein